MRGVIILFFIITSAVSLAADPELDSLHQSLTSSAQVDTSFVKTLVSLGNYHGHHSNVDSTKYYFHQAIYLGGNIQYAKGKFNAYMGLAHFYQKWQSYDTAFMHFDSAEVYAKKTGRKHDLFHAIYKRGLAYCYKRDLENTRKYYDQALAYAKKEQLSENLAVIYNAFGVYEYYRGNHVEGLKHLEKANAEYEALGDPYKMSSVCNNMGIIYLDQEDHKNGKIVFRRGLHLLDSAGIYPTVKYKLYINLAILYNRNDQYDSAIALLKTSIRQAEENHDDVFNFYSRTYLTESYRGAKNYQLALDNMTKALTIAKKLQSPAYIARSYLELAIIQNNMGKPQEALNSLLQEGLEEQQTDVVSKIRYNVQLSMAHRALKQYDSALKYGTKALELAKKSELKERISSGALDLYETYKLIGNTGKALEYHELHKAYEDSIFNQNKSRELGRLQADIENQKEKRLLLEKQKQKEIELQKQKVVRDMLLLMVVIVAVLAFFIYNNYRKKVAANNQLRQMNAEIHEQKEEILAQNEEITVQKEYLYEKNVELEQLNKEKNGLISVVAHDLRSPLNKNKGLAAVIKMGGELDEDQLLCLDTIEKVCEGGLKLIEEILYMHAIERQESQPKQESVNISVFLKGQASGYAEMAKKKEINLHVDIPEQEIWSMVDYGYLNRIVDNLMSNAIKYTYRSRSVFLGLEESQGMVNIKIKDEGQGFSEEDQKHMFKKFQRLSAQPTAGESSTGLGLSIVKNLVDKLGGKLSFKSKQKVGTEFIISLPAEKKMTAQKVA